MSRKEPRHLFAEFLLFSTSNKWCGRIIDGNGYTLDPANYEAFKNATNPTNGAELCHFVHVATWRFNAIPFLHKQIEPLNSFLKKAYKAAGIRKKKCVRKIRLLDIGWDDSCDQAFSQVRNSLCNAVKLSHRDPKTFIRVHTDAIDRFWSGIVTQCCQEELGKPLVQQPHDPLAFLGSLFTLTQERWTTYEREAICNL